MGESKLLLALFCNKILTKSEQGVVVVVISWRSDCVTLTVTLQLYRGGECGPLKPKSIAVLRRHPLKRSLDRRFLQILDLGLRNAGH